MKPYDSGGFDGGCCRDRTCDIRRVKAKPPITANPVNDLARELPPSTTQNGGGRVHREVHDSAKDPRPTFALPDRKQPVRRPILRLPKKRQP